MVLLSITKWVREIFRSAGDVKLLRVGKSPANGKNIRKDLTKRSKLLKRQQIRFNTDRHDVMHLGEKYFEQ